MAVIGSNILAGSSSAVDAYTIDQSLRVNQGDSALLQRTFGSGSQTTWTWSAWVKRADLILDTGDGPQELFGQTSGHDNINFTTDSGASSGDGDFFTIAANAAYLRKTYAEYRDVAGWYHIVVVRDTTNATDQDRCRIYINGYELVAADYSINVSITQNSTSYINSAVPHQVFSSAGSSHCGLYGAEVHFIDGQALTAASFGETNSTTNQWVPIEYDGTYGTNGFYQKYASTELANSFPDSADKDPTPNGTVHTDTAIKKIGTASAEFDGDSDFLQLLSSTDYNFGTDAWTLECWFYDRDPSDGGMLFAQGGDGANSAMFQLYTVNASQTLYGDFKVGATYYRVNSSTTIVADTWYHVAIVNSYGTLTMYLNGTSEDTVDTSGISFDMSGSTTQGSGNVGIQIGTNMASTTPYYWDGYIDEYRISSMARYTSNFTAPTTAFTTDSNTKLLLHMDGSNDGTSFPDSSGTGRHTVTAFGDIVNTRAVTKIGDSSIYSADGSDDYMTVDGSDFARGTSGDFTIEMWFKAESSHAAATIINRNSTPARFWLNKDGTTSPDGLFMHTHDTVDLRSPAGADPWDGAWHHVAVVRASQVGTLYLDGVGGDAETWDIDFDPGGYMFYRNASTATYEFNGYLDEIRISDTARYTSNFTPSTTAFTEDSNTQLLIHGNWTGGLGADSSGNRNTFAVTNLVAADQMKDSPTNNFATLNPLDQANSPAFSEGNLSLSSVTGGEYESTRGTIGSPATGKWYWEACETAGAASGGSGYHQEIRLDIIGNAVGDRRWLYQSEGTVYDGSTTISTDVAAYGLGDIVQIAWDIDASKIWFGKNNTWQGAGSPNPATATSPNFSNLTSNLIPGLAVNQASTTLIANFGQDSTFAGGKTGGAAAQDVNEKGDFYYAPPTDFLALCTSNLPDPEITDPTDHFNTVLYTGDASTRSITDVGFQSDLIWGKSRNATNAHVWTDSVRGTDSQLSSQRSNAEDTQTDVVTSFDTNGFSVGASVGFDMNHSGSTLAVWNWKGDGVAGGTLNEVGTIDSQVNVNTTAGFSIVKYTGNDTGGATVGHGLSQAPNYVILKPITLESSWKVNSDSFAMTDVMYLDDTSAAGADVGRVSAFGATTFTLASSNQGVNSSSYSYIAYCFHSVEGYSKVGSYKGNSNTDGPFIYTGFKPAFIMVKLTTAADGYWVMFDNKRDPDNPTDRVFYANINAISTDVSSYSPYDFLSNGFKSRIPGGNGNEASYNSNNQTYLYLAFAETPFKTADAR